MPTAGPSRAGRPARLRPVRGRDHGSSALELAIVTPVIFLLLGTAVQVGLWYHGQAIALAAAQEGARSARIPAANEDIADQAGTDRARAYLDQLNTQVLKRGSVQISSERGDANARAAAAGGVGDVVSIRVRGKVLSLVPGFALSVDEVSTVTVERFRGDQEARP